MIRSIIVDDEKPAREVLRNYLAEFCPDVEIVAAAGSVQSALKSILQHHPELVFLDIDMPDGTGFDLLRQIPRIDFKVIFITAFSEFAVKAFRFYATDYLLKPVNINELMDAVDKARTVGATPPDNRNIQELLKISDHSGERFDNIIIPDKKGFKVIDVNDIVHCEADGYCTHFFISGSQKITSSKNLKFYEEILEEKCFLRVHNSYMINLRHVKYYSIEGLIYLTGDLNVPLGNTYKKKFLDKFSGCR